VKRSFVFALAASAAIAAVLLAQDQLPQPTFRAEANYVRVDVFPTRDGMPVTDLTAADFELFEDRAPQRIEQFEHVLIRAAGIDAGRREPNTVAESQAAIKDPRTRVFVLFLDPSHVELGTSRKISQTLVNTLNRLIGPDDYIGVMIPPMQLRDVTFARRTVIIQRLLERDWWGNRDSILPQDEVEEQYAYCYGESGILSAPAVGQEMILRRREQMTFDALENLVVNVRDLREERKAVLAITDGWLIYRPNPQLAGPLGDKKNVPPSNPPIGVDPRNGRLSTDDPNGRGDTALRKCELDRQALATIDDDARLRTIIQEANRSNTSFYPVDPRGLTVFDEAIVPATPIPSRTPPPMLGLQEESARLRARADGLRQLADGTDGTAVVNTNNIEPALRRIVDDLSSYYLLGYYSTGKLDGKFHAINVRVKRPGVTVRARRGYQALRESDVARAITPGRTTAPAGTSAEAAFTAAASSAVAKIVNAARDLPLRVYVSAGWRPSPDGKPAAAFWAVGEVVDRIPGADLDAVLLNAAGDVVSSAKGRIVPGTTSLQLTIASETTLAPGEYTLRMRSQSPAGSETMSMPIVLPQAPQSSGGMFIRRGPTTGNKETPTADVRFRRSERVRVEVPSAADVTSARLLDRTGRAMTAIPVAASTRTDSEGTKWATAEVLLAPLAPGDYIIEVVAGDVRTLAAFRIVL
jgi:VWFA-related protein